MASNPPGKCCTILNLHEGSPVGKVETIFGLESYVTGKENPSSRVIVILTDIFGHNLKNVTLIADFLAKEGKYQVYVPDILKGDPYDANKEGLPAWLANHTVEETKDIVGDYLKALHSEISPSFVGLIGYCFGAKFCVGHIAEGGLANVAALAHPSFVTIEDVAAIRKPVLISAAETDTIFTTELRHATEAKLAEIKARYQMDLFSGVEHGYACRGDLTNPVVKYAAEKTLKDQLEWFSLF